MVAELMARYAYADPPYLGLAAKFYGHLHPDAADYDRPETHRQLIERLCDEYPDGWAMSLHSPSLREILPMCPADVRVMAWVKPFASYKRGVNPAYAWEPVIVRGGRQPRIATRTREGGEPLVADWVAVPITLRRGLTGVKPDAFVWWLMAVLGVRAEDEVVDLFPGSGAVTRAIETWRRQAPLGMAG
jgi:hypothetical protein